MQHEMEKYFVTNLDSTKINFQFHFLCTLNVQVKRFKICQTYEIRKSSTSFFPFHVILSDNLNIQVQTNKLRFEEFHWNLQSNTITLKL